MNEEIEYIRLVGEERRMGQTLEEVSRHWKEKPGELFVYQSA